MSQKPTQAELDRRIDEVMRLIAAGYNRRGIIQHVAEKTDWNVSERTVDNYLKRASEQFEADSQINRNREIGKAHRRFEMLFAASVKVQDYQRAIAAERERVNLLGLAAPQVLELRGAEVNLLAQVLELLKARGMNPSDVFNAMLQELAQENTPNGR